MCVVVQTEEGSERDKVIEGERERERERERENKLKRVLLWQ